VNRSWGARTAESASRPDRRRNHERGDHLEAVAQRLDLVKRQIGEANDRIDHLTETR